MICTHCKGSCLQTGRGDEKCPWCRGTGEEPLRRPRAKKDPFVGRVLVQRGWGRWMWEDDVS